MLAKSKLSWKQKRTVLTQELLRILLDCSAYVPCERVIVHANNMVLRMQYSGYSKKFQHEVVNATLQAYDEIHKLTVKNIHCTHHLTGIGMKGTKLRGMKWVHGT